MQDKTKQELAIVLTFFLFSMLLASAVFVFAHEVSAQDVTTSSTSTVTTTTTTTAGARKGLVVSPAKLGILRLTIPLFSDYVENKSFSVGNAYDYPINITLGWNGNVSQVAEHQQKEIVLQPNESRKVYYTLTISEPGFYDGGATVIAKAAGKTTYIGYQADLYVFAYKSQVPENALYAVGGLAVLAAVGFGIKKYRSGSRGGAKKHAKKLKIVFAAVLFFAVSSSLVAAVEGADIALVVKDANSLNLDHEQRIYNILNDMGHDVFLVDKNIGVNYTNFDLVVIAGRPLGGGPLDSFVASIPANDVPTILIDYYYPDDFGWVKVPGVSSLSSSDKHKVYIQAIHPITNGFALNQKVYVHLIQGYTIVDLVKTKTNLTMIASADVDGGLPIIAYANPNTQLANGKKVGNNAAVIFIGTTYPNLWTEDMVKLFKNSVNFMTTLNFDPPSVPQLTNPAEFFDKDGTVTFEWTASTHSTGIDHYQFQLATNPTFTTLITDTSTNSLSFTISGLADQQTYYARVRAWNTLNIYSDWSNSKVTIDSTDMLIKINAPVSGSSIAAGSSVFVNATFATPNRMPTTNGTCNVTIANTFAGTIAFNKTINTCSGTVTSPTLSFIGSSNLAVSAKNTLGNTNSSSIPIEYQGSVPQSESSSSSSGGGGSSFYGALLSIEVPTQMSGYENSDLTFTVKVKNDGLVEANSVKVLVNDIDFAFPEVSPALVDVLNAGQTQDFIVTLHLPEDSASNYQFKVKVLAYGASMTRRIYLEVLPEKLEPQLRSGGAQLPETFTAGQETTVNYTIVNDGNAGTRATVDVNLPSGWTIRKEDQKQPIDVDEASQETVLFHVTPSDSGGKMEFVASYTVDGQAGGQEKTISESYDVTIEQGFLGSVTGMLAFIGKPEFYIPALLGLGAFFAVYYGASGGIGSLRLPKPRFSRFSRSLPLASTISSAVNSATDAAGHAASNLGKGFNSWVGRNEQTLRYVWPRGSKALFESIFAGALGASAGASASRAARSAQRPRRMSTSPTRALPKISMYEKWEMSHHRGNGL